MQQEKQGKVVMSRMNICRSAVVRVTFVSLDFALLGTHDEHAPGNDASAVRAVAPAGLLLVDHNPGVRTPNGMIVDGDDGCDGEERVWHDGHDVQGCVCREAVLMMESRYTIVQISWGVDSMDDDVRRFIPLAQQKIGPEHIQTVDIHR